MARYIYRGLLVAASLASMSLVGMATHAGARERQVVVTAQREELPTRRVSYRDLNLASLQGERTLKFRVKGAAYAVCSDSGLESYEVTFDKCRGSAWEGALPQIDRAVRRARDIASTGHSDLAMVAITISVPPAQ